MRPTIATLASLAFLGGALVANGPALGAEKMSPAEKAQAIKTLKAMIADSDFLIKLDEDGLRNQRKLAKICERRPTDKRCHPPEAPEPRQK